MTTSTNLAGIVPARSADLEATASGAPTDLVDTPEAGASVIRGSFLRLGGHVLGALATVVSSAVVIRHLGVVDTGRFVTVMALVVIVASISDFGLSAVGVREFSVRPRGEAHRFLRNLLGARLALVILGCAVAVVFAIVAGYTETMVWGTVLGSIGIVLFVLQQSLAIPLHARLRFGWVAGLQLIFQVGVAIEAALLALAGAGLLPFYALWIPILLPVLALTFVVGGAETRVLPAADADEWRSMLRRILPYAAAVVLSVLYFRVVQIMMSLLSSDTETGYFGVSFRVLESLTIVPGLLASTALPVLARAGRDDASRFDYAGRRLAEAMLLGGIGLALVLCLGSHAAVAIVAGAEFERSADVLRILAVALVGTFVIAARGYALLALGRLRAMLVSNAIALAIVIGAGIPLISAHGARGGAVTLVAAELALGVCYEVALTRGRAQLRPEAGFVGRVVLAIVLATLVVVVLDLPSLAAALLGAAIYALVLTVLRAVPAELRQALWPSGSVDAR